MGKKRQSAAYCGADQLHGEPASKKIVRISINPPTLISNYDSKNKSTKQIMTNPLIYDVSAYPE
jgi:hypothetical protein